MLTKIIIHRSRYDRMIREDEFVIGATIYSLEIPGNWAPYDVAAAVPQLIRRVSTAGTFCIYALLKLWLHLQQQVFFVCSLSDGRLIFDARRYMNGTPPN